MQVWNALYVDKMHGTCSPSEPPRGSTESRTKQPVRRSILKKGHPPGGTTERAINTFEDGGMRDLVQKAYNAAFERSQEMSKELADKQ